MALTDDTGAARLDALQSVIATAHGLAADLAADPLVTRILRAFMQLPPAEREPILQVVERDAAWRKIIDETVAATGIAVRPNPHASLYVHVFHQVTGAPIAPEPSERDLHVIRLGIERFLPLLPLVFQEGVHAQWTASTRELVRAAGPELRALAARLAREVLALVAEADGQEGGAPRA